MLRVESADSELRYVDLAAMRHLTTGLTFDIDRCARVLDHALGGLNEQTGKRGWSLRFNEHTRAAIAQKSKRLLARTLNDLIEARAAELYGITDGRPKLAGLVSAVCGVGMSRDDALDAEERLVDKYSLASKHPYGLNMISGGLAGLKHARRFLRDG
jgi:hypothetical protein